MKKISDITSNPAVNIGGVCLFIVLLFLAIAARKCEQLAEATPNRVRVLVIGDSYTSGVPAKYLDSPIHRCTVPGATLAQMKVTVANWPIHAYDKIYIFFGVAEYARSDDLAKANDDLHELASYVHTLFGVEPVVVPLEPIIALWNDPTNRTDGNHLSPKGWKALFAHLNAIGLIPQ